MRGATSADARNPTRDHVRHVLLTGASGGLGSALAQALAGRGDRVTLMGRDASRLAAAVALCQSVPSGGHETICCDVTNAAHMHDALLSADRDGPVDILIANAGKGGSAVLAPASGEPLDLARSIIDVNVLGVINSIAPLLERMVERRQGHIVIVSSMAARQGLAEAPVYAASKAAVSVYGHGLRRLLAPHNVRVTIVEPGYIATPMSASLPFQRPFELSAARAAELIVRGIDRGAAEIIFPWQLRWATWLLRLLPMGVVDRALTFASAQTRSRR